MGSRVYPLMRTFKLLTFALAAPLVACIGTIGDADTPDGGNLPPGTDVTVDTSFACDPQAVPVPNGMRRLTKAQLTNSIRDALVMLVPNQASTIADEIATPLAAVPDDVLGGDTDYRSMVQAVGQAHVDAYYTLAQAFGAALVSTTTRRNALLGSCATDATTSNDSTCIDNAIRRVGRVLFRRPLGADELTLYRDVYNAADIDEQALADAMTALMLAPPFIYLIETGAAVRDSAQKIYDLGPYELASRLSYHFWQSLPDEALLSAAADGSLMTDAGYRAQVDRLFADPKARRTTQAFYGEWLKLDTVPNMSANNARPDFAAYAGDDLPSADLRGRILADIQDMVAYYTFTTAGTLADLFSSTLSFARTSDVASLYGDVSLWDGASQPPAHVQPERVGILARAAMLVNNQATTRPIKRGVFTLRRLLCEDIKLPDNMAAIALELSDGTQTTRQRITELSQAPGSTCQGCHVAINPLGFVAESFDALGRVRAAERVFEPTTGALLATLPIDTHVETTVDAGPERGFDSVADISEAIVASGRVQACFARHYVRFTFGRQEDPRRDGCVLENLRQRIASSGSLADMLKSIAMADTFKLVRKPD